MEFKPDRHNGQQIFRGVDQVGGVNHQNDAILFPPTVLHGRPPVVPVAQLIAEAQDKIQVVMERDAPKQVQSNITAFVIQIRKAIAFWIKRATLNERERIRLALEKHGLHEAQHAMMDGAD